MKNSLQLSKKEISMMCEISDIFKKYKSSTRAFGINLIHNHFEIEKDEILYETHNKSNRTLFTLPVKKKNIQSALATSWQINEDRVISVSSLCCDYDPPDFPDHPNA
jgi:hypothetical protein